jgi:ABC transporter DrrB family efflux protein
MTTTTVTPTIAPEVIRSRATARPGPVQTVRHIGAMTRRLMIHMIRQPDTMFFLVFQPLMFVMLFRYVFGGAIQVPGGEYVNFLIPGVLVQTVAFNGAATAFGLVDDMQKGILDRFRALPVGRSTYLIARIANDGLFRQVLTVVVITAVGFLVGYRPDGFLPTLGMVALAVAFGVAFSFIGAVIGTTLKTVEAVGSAGLSWLFPVTFVSSAFLPPDTMPSWLQVIADNNPVTLAADAMRGMTLGGEVATPLTQTLIWLVAISVVFGTIAVRRYRKVA